MMVLQAKAIAKEFEGIPVLREVTFHLAGGERVGLVGLNGCGKSTLLKILAGKEMADGGHLSWVTAGLRLGYLAQEGHFAPDERLGDQLGPLPDDLLHRCGVSREMLAQRAGALSGGQRTRAALARLLAGRPDLLLLDEPTNHLDMEGLAWLESLLIRYPGTVLVVSHDRHFLDRVVTRILELDGGKARSFPGNYTAYAALKRAEQERAEAEYRQYLKEKRQLEEAIRRQMEWARASHSTKAEFGAPMNWKDYQRRQAKAHMRVAKSMGNRLERIRVERPRDQAQINLTLDSHGRVGRNLILAEGMGFSYDGRRWLVRDASFYVQRGERVAVVGPNGAGKTTLLRLLLGELTPTEGRLYRSPLRVGYLAQELESLEPNLTVLEAATDNAALAQEARTLLGCLLFVRDDVRKRVGSLSGGEKVRLALARLLLQGPDMLVLDEPTNGLDLASRERVEEALEGYSGTLLLASHDRYLLRRFATRILRVANGSVESFSGTYEAFLDRTPAAGEPTPGAPAQPLSASERRDLRLLLETRLAQLGAQLASPPEGEADRLNAEFIRLSRELRALKP